jgi:hypothetical protein
LVRVVLVARLEQLMFLAQMGLLGAHLILALLVQITPKHLVVLVV